MPVLRLFVIMMAVVALAGMSSSNTNAKDISMGKSVFGRCAACHSIKDGGRSLGPYLAGVVGRRAGVVKGYPYSKAMAQSDITWNRATLDKFLERPQAVVPGTKMGMAGLTNAKDRANLIAYLETLGK